MTRALALLTKFKSFIGRQERLAQDESEELRLARRKIADKNEQLTELRKEVGKRDQELVGLRREPEPMGFMGRALPVFFIVGRAKSGTSWLRSIMDTHPEILCVNEGRFFGRDYRGHGVIPRSLYSALADSKYLTTWVKRSPWSRGEDAERHVRNLTRHVIEYFMAEKLTKTGKKFAGDKTPLISTEVIAEIAAIYPEAKVIHIVRDGRDVAISSMHHIWNNARDKGGPNDLGPEVLDKRDRYRADPEGFRAHGESIFADGQLAATARNWANLVGSAREDGPALLDNNYVEVRYEDLLERPEKEVVELLRFLGADDTKGTVQRCVEAASFERVAKRERGEEDSSSFFRKGVAGDWKGVFTAEDRRIFKEAAGDLLVELDYEKGHDW